MSDRPKLGKRIEHAIVGLLTPGATYRRAKTALVEARDARRELREIKGTVDDAASGANVRRLLDAQRGEATRRLDAMEDDRAVTQRAISDLARRVDALRHGLPRPPEPEDPPEEGLDALLDAFYNRLEARYRGGREEIMRRLRVYLADAEAAHEATGKPILDLGCGRGEWLELLQARGIPASGVDLNPVQAEEAQALGLDVSLGDACKHLSEQADGSLGMITAHHLVEHLPFRTVAWIAREALAKLAPGGILLLETPNPGNILVGAKTFHMDPTHLRPLPGEVLEALLDTVGFRPVEIRALHPHERRAAFSSGSRLDPEIAELMFGPQDTAALAIKPAT